MVKTFSRHGRPGKYQLRLPKKQYMFFKKLNLYYNTLKHVKLTQLYHQVYYRLKKHFLKKKYNQSPSSIAKLKLQPSISYPISFKKCKKFSFLNFEKQFFSEIDWNFSEYGKLWTYNLNYFEFLHQEGMKKEEGLKLIQKYISKKDSLKDGQEPYPTSLRGINWIKFLSQNKIKDPKINEFLFQNYLRLLDELEYHLLANHLLENGFSLLFGAYYFKDETFYAKGKKIVTQQLNEQILNDGAHYELSPMYHQIILYRVLDTMNLVRNNDWKKEDLDIFLLKKAEQLLAFLQNISFRNKETPNLNDAADGVAPETNALLRYASELEVKCQKMVLKGSGYRRFEYGDLEVLIDIGQIAPQYQPGHSHADSLQFLFNYKNQPVIVDTGVSTYEKNERRQLERSTQSHNTVTVNGTNSSEVWGGFRVAKRAKVTVIKDEEFEIEAFHDGYKDLGVVHYRKFFQENHNFRIKDIIQSKDHYYDAKGHLHFHPDVQIQLVGKMLYINQDLKVAISGVENLKIEEYQFAAGYNQLIPATKLVYKFKEEAELNIMPLLSNSFSSSIAPEDEKSSD